MIATALVLALSAQASSPEPNRKTWEWDSKLPTCALEQRGPDGVQRVKIERTPGGEETQIFLTLEPGLELGKRRVMDTTVRMDSGSEYGADISSALDSAGRSKLYIVSADPAFIDSLSSTGSFSILFGERIITIPVEVPAEVVASLRVCEDSKMRDWGIDPIAWRGLQSRPLPAERMRDRFRDLDYPADALTAHIEADAVVRLDVRPDGSVTMCHMVNAGVPRSFEAASCKVLNSARFIPARDNSGKPVAAPIVYDVRFRIGG